MGRFSLLPRSPHPFPDLFAVAFCLRAQPASKTREAKKIPALRRGMLGNGNQSMFSTEPVCFAKTREMPDTRSDNSHYEKLNGIERCIDDEIPFEIPDSWTWVRCGEVFQHNTGKALNASNRSGHLLRYITTSNLYWDRFELEKLKEMFFTDAEIDKCTVQKGDLLVCEGGDFGRAAIWNFDSSILIQNHIHRLRSYAKICARFFYYLFFFYKSAGLIGGKGIGIQGLSSNALHALLFPLPPLAEQKRIVDAIDHLFRKLTG